MTEVPGWLWRWRVGIVSCHLLGATTEPLGSEHVRGMCRAGCVALGNEEPSGMRLPVHGWTEA